MTLISLTRKDIPFPGRTGLYLPTDAWTNLGRKMTLEAIRYSQGRLEVLDQLLLPAKTEYVPIDTVQDGWNAIKSMQVRGAPAIAIVGCLSLAVELYRKQFASVRNLVEFCVNSLDFLVTARPTAVNIRTAADQLRGISTSLLEQNEISVDSAKARIIKEIESMLMKDVADNTAIGDYGAADMMQKCHKNRLNILTHCNTGSLATAGYGTALGVVRSLQKQGNLEHCFFNETRPYCQGSRLTAYEVVTEKIPSTLICDSAAASLMASGKVDAICTGADRVAANGDTANKIGTYMLAVLAKHHNIPFYIAAPATTCDMAIASGKDIVIEERDADEITMIQGHRISPLGTNCWNPAFDVTPAELITGGIITERGVFKPAELKAALAQQG